MVNTNHINSLRTLFAPLKKITFHKNELEAEKAYDLWAFEYDEQPNNLMLAMDQSILSELINRIDVKGKILGDIGCGTGRYWHQLLKSFPKEMIGYDVSSKMLDQLKFKFPQARTQKVEDYHLKNTPDNYFDILVTTLTIAHIEKLREAILEWKRVLKAGGKILITDFHPFALSKGAKRTFRFNNTTVTVKNYVHSIQTIENIFSELDFEIEAFKERVIDDSVFHFYQKSNAVRVYEKYKGVPMIFGMLLTKMHASS